MAGTPRKVAPNCNIQRQKVPQIIYLFYNFMNIPHWIPWKPEEFSSPFLGPRRAPCIASSISGGHCELQNTHLPTK